jgi:hypothetical protein
MSLTIPTIFTIPHGSGSSYHASGDGVQTLPVSTTDYGSGVDPRYQHKFGFPYKGGKSTFAFYGAWSQNVTIKIQAAFDGGYVTNNTETYKLDSANENFMTLKDSAGAEVVVNSSQRIVNVDIGKCMLRFLISGDNADLTAPIYVAVS